MDLIVAEPYASTYACDVATRIVPKTELRERIREELSAIGDDTLVITARGRPIAVVVSVERWNRVQEALEDQEDAIAVLEHRSSPRRGRKAEAVFAALGAGEPRVRGSHRSPG